MVKREECQAQETVTLEASKGRRTTGMSMIEVSAGFHILGWTGRPFDALARFALVEVDRWLFLSSNRRSSESTSRTAES